MNVYARMNSFHAVRKQNSAVTASAGRDERQRHAPEGVEARAAVEQHGLLELARQGVEVALEHEDAERDRGGRVDQHEAEQVVEQVQPVEQDVERNRGDDAGEHLRDEERAQARLPADEAEARQRVGGGAGERARRATVTDAATTIELNELAAEEPAAGVVVRGDDVDEVAAA